MIYIGCGILILIILALLIYQQTLIKIMFDNYKNSVEDLTNKIIAKDSNDYQILKDDKPMEEALENMKDDDDNLEGFTPLSEVAPENLPTPEELLKQGKNNG